MNRETFKQSFAHGSNRLRVGRTAIENQIHLITFTIKNRALLFTDFGIAASCSYGLNNSEAWPSAKLLCWVLMPNHFHGLIQLGDSEPLAIVTRRLKAHLTRTINSKYHLSGPLWQQGFHDHALKRNEDTLSVAGYIVMNPIRAKLCSRIGDYPFWDALWL
jgi:putative transposase